MDHGPSRMNAGVLLFKNSEWTKEFLQRRGNVMNNVYKAMFTWEFYKRMFTKMIECYK